MQRAHATWKKESIQRRMFRAMIVVGVFVLLSAFLTSAVILADMFYAQVSADFERMCNLVGAAIDDGIAELGNLCYLLYNDSATWQYFTGNYASHYERYAIQKEVDALLRLLFTPQAETDVCLLVEAEEMVYTNLVPDQRRELPQSRLYFQQYALDMRALQQADWHREMEAEARTALLCTDCFSLPGFSGANARLALIQPFYSMGQRRGYIVILAGNAWIESILAESGMDASAVVLGPSGVNLYNSGRQAEALSVRALEGDAMQSASLAVLGKEWNLVYCDPSERYYGLTIFMASNLSPLFFSLLHMLGIYLLVGATISAAAIGISARQARKITEPIIDMVREIDADPAAFHLAPPADAAREVRILADCLNQMRLRIQLLLENMLDMHLMQKNAELRALKQQVNPHFLYNTIETINSMAMISGCTEICSIVSCMGNMLRYSLEMDGGETVPLSKEIQHLRNYLSINCIRGLQFKSEIDVSEELQAALVPRLILQPLVENCFRHGFKAGRRNCQLYVRGERREGNISLVIEDNGVGMTPNRLWEVRRRLDSRRNAADSIGVYNVHQRIRMLYGEEYGVALDSTVGVGTVVRITLPYICGEKRNGQA